MLKSTKHVLLIFLSFGLSARADVITDWSEVLLDAIRVDRTTPPVASRAMAMMTTAMFDAVNAIDGSYEPFMELDLSVDPGGASKEAAASAAAHRVLVAVYPAQAATLDTTLDNALSGISSGNAKDRGIAIGEAAGDAMLALRADDGWDAVVPYDIGDQPGDWQPTPPAFLATPVLPQWPYVTPFCMSRGDQLRRTGPPDLSSSEWVTNFNETKSLGAANSTVRTADESQIALFWLDGPGTATPPGHWFQIARDVASQQGNTLEENARLFALIGLAVADAGIVSWDNKYAFDDWRPVTAIRAADTDGNPATEPDPNWSSFIPTPPFPSYTSGHSTFSGAASRILSLFYDDDLIAFTTRSDDVPGVERSYNSFSAASNEAGRSRIYGGIHWEYDNQDGLASGRELATSIFDNFLRPVNRDVIEIPAEDVIRCGPIGLFPLAVLCLTFVGCRRRR